MSYQTPADPEPLLAVGRGRDDRLERQRRGQPGPDLPRRGRAGPPAAASAVQGLGRPLASGANGTVVVPLIPPGTQYSDRRTQLDSRVTKRFTVGRYNLEGSLDLNNLFNSSGVLGFISTYGGNWLVPRSIQFGRSVKFTARVTH